MKIIINCLLSCLFVGVPLHAQEYLQDPRTRNESIADTGMNVDVSQVGEAWMYEYTINAGNANAGTINFFEMDLLCAGAVDDRGFDPAPWSTRPYDNLYAGNNIVPVALAAEDGASWGFDVTTTGKAMFAVKVPPGTVNGKIRVYSAYGPGKREYTLQPFFPIDERWDYEGIEEGEPGVPTLHDFQVTGLVTGPACPGNETDPEPVLFDGSSLPWESEEENALLRYATPDRDRFVSRDDVLVIEIHYSDRIDAGTFKVTPARSGARALFNPEPGTSETVELPLGKEYVNLKLEVKSASDGPGRKGADSDIDFFEINHVLDAGKGKN